MKNLIKSNIVYFLFFSSFIILICRIFLEPTYITIPYHLSKEQIPIITAKINDKEIPLKLSLTSKYPLYLDENILKGIKKISKKEASWKNIKGEQQNAPLFEIPTIHLGDLNLKKTLVTSQLPDSKNEQVKGEIVWPFEKMNLLLDIPHKKIYGIRNDYCLKSLGIELKKMHKIKCKINKKGIHFDINTSIGELKTILETSCNVNGISNSKWNCTSDYFVDTIKIGNKDFKEEKFYPFEVTPELELDAVLGMGFLKNHIVYIDHVNEYIYIGEKFGNFLSKDNSKKIPIQFTFTGLPVINAVIEKENYQLVLDLGFGSELTLPTTFINKDLEHANTSTFINVYGEEDEVQEYILPECNIGGNILNNIFIKIRDKIGVTSSVHTSKKGNISTEKLGYLGYLILYRTNIYCDFPNSFVYFVNQNEELNKKGIALNTFEQVPFNLEKCGIVINAQTDLGPLKLMVDTGAGGTFIKKQLLNKDKLQTDSLENPYFPSSTFNLGNTNFGTNKFYPLEITDKFGDIDGIIGMEFLREHAFYIDFSNRILYFAKP